MKNLMVIIVLALLIGSPCYCQDSTDVEHEEVFNDLEFEIAMGYGRSNELNAFNSSIPYQPMGGFSFNIGGRGYASYNFSIGIHIKGYFDMVRNYNTLTTMGYSNSSDLMLVNLNMGINARYTWGKQWQPYFFTGIGYAPGWVLAKDYSEPLNSFKGIVFDVGAGLGLMVDRNVMLSLSLAQSIGIAWWEFEPSYNASDKKFNPGYLTIQLGVSIFMRSDFD